MIRTPLLCVAALGAALAPFWVSAGSEAVGSAQLRQQWLRLLGRETPLEPAMEFPYQGCFRQAANRHRLPLVLLLAVARGESDFDPMARSPANARGLMQIQWPETARHLGIERLSRLHEPCANVDAGARYLRELLDRYQGDLHLALAAYNYGPGRIAVGARRIPEGAAWYSEYIYGHLRYVVAPPAAAPTSPRFYSELRELDLIVFHRSYRAAAFVTRVQRQLPGLSVGWFRRGNGAFVVVLQYHDPSGLDRARRALRRAGFPTGRG